MKGKKWLFPAALVILACALLSTPAAAKRTLSIDGRVRSTGLPKSVPGQLNYQGYLADAADSSTITATLEMTFRLFDSETDGTELWSETHPTVEVTGGLFQVLLGSMTSFPANLFDGSPRWLQTEVGTEILVPRKPLVSVAYSQRTEMADHAATADWATDAQNAVHADSADHCPGISAWTVSGDDVYREIGKVGIGTASPLTELDVDGSVNATTYYGDGSNLTGISATPDSDWIVSAPDIYSALAGKVGIGITHPTTKLEVNGTVKATTYYGDGSNLTGISGTTDNDWTIDGDDIYHETGKVGIGTTSPSGELQVVGSARIGVGAAWLDISNDGWLFDANAAVTVNDQLRVLSSAESYFNGSLGIGTPSPSEKLDVHGTIKAVAAEGPHFIIHDSNGSNDRPGIQFTNNSIHYIGGDDGSDEYFGFYSQYVNTRSYDAHLRVHGKATSNWGKYIDLTHDGTDAIISTDAGDIVLSPAANVGIGTSSPVEKLVIQGSGPKLALNTTNSSATAVYFQESGSTKWSIAYAPGSDYLYFYDFTKGGTRMVLQDGTGYVGIGTGSPTAPLDVAGTAKADTVRVDHDLIVTGVYKGTIGPNNGAPFPRPAYDSGWQSIDAGVPLGVVHDVGGDIDDYVIDMQVNGGTSNRYLTSDAIYWDSLTNSGMAVYRVPGDLTVSTVRIRIWMYN